MCGRELNNVEQEGRSGQPGQAGKGSGEVEGGQ